MRGPGLKLSYSEKRNIKGRKKEYREALFQGIMINFNGIRRRNGLQKL